MIKLSNTAWFWIPRRGGGRCELEFVYAGWFSLRITQIVHGRWLPLRSINKRFPFPLPPLLLRRTAFTVLRFFYDYSPIEKLVFPTRLWSSRRLLGLSADYTHAWISSVLQPGSQGQRGKFTLSYVPSKDRLNNIIRRIQVYLVIIANSFKFKSVFSTSFTNL